MFLSSGCLRFSANLSLTRRHIWLITYGLGNGWSSGFLARYSLSISAVRVLSLYVPEACPFVPSMLTIPCSVSIFLRCSLCSSSPSTPISAMRVKIVAYRLVEAEIIFVTFSRVGIIGVPCSHLYLGLSHCMPLVLVNHSYARQKLDLLDSDSFELAITVFTSLGFLRSATLLSCLSRCRKALIVFSALPSFLALVRVFIISFSYFTGCWGRRIAIGLVGILVPIRLEWFSIPAWGVGDPGFKSQRPHHNTSTTFFGWFTCAF